MKARVARDNTLFLERILGDVMIPPSGRSCGDMLRL
jgi:hypothetical protein